MSRHKPATGSFTIDRQYAAPPARVYAAWTDPAQKARWFVGPRDWELVHRTLDVRVGGEEILHGRFASPGGMETRFTARYHHVAPEQCLVYVYDMHLNGIHHSVSLATLEFIAIASGTQLTFTEQVVFLDGTGRDAGVASRQHGTAAHLDRIHALLD